MASPERMVRHTFGGGWATDFGPSSDIGVDQTGGMQIPFLVDAENVIYDILGNPSKIGGTTRVNSSALESGADIKGLFDFWISGTAGTPVQHRITHVSTVIKKDDADGSFTDIFTGLEDDKIASYSVMNDILMMASNSTTDVPKSWDGSTAQNLAGSPPNFSISAVHKNRVWAAGDAANAGRLYFSVLLDGEDWTGAGSGSIDIDPDDNDIITGLVSHRNELWVFKGPKSGSIHRITGSAPTGDDGFARTTFIRGVGAIGQNTIFQFRDDIGFMWSDGTIRSLVSTDRFGNFTESALSRPINGYMEEHLNFGRLAHAHAATWPALGIVLFSIPIDGSSNNNITVLMDYRFEPVRWALLPAYTATSGALAQVIDSGSANRTVVMGGGTDGFVRRFLQADRSIDGSTAINYKITTPFLNYSDGDLKKTIHGGSLGIVPLNNGDLIFNWQRDSNTRQTETVNQGGTAVLGTASANQFTLGTSTLGGGSFVDKFFRTEEGGEFHAVQYQVTNSVISENVRLSSVSTLLSVGARSMEN